MRGVKTTEKLAAEVRRRRGGDTEKGREEIQSDWRLLLSAGGAGSSGEVVGN